MSDALTALGVPPPIDRYFDPDVYAAEQHAIFAKAPIYYGHRSMVPTLGDYYTLPWMDHARVLTHHADGIELLSNICRHRQAQILIGKGNQAALVCPLHRWTYNHQGQLLGAPQFSKPPCLNLTRYPLTEWNGLLFDATRDIKKDLDAVGQQSALNLSDFHLHRVELSDCAFNWKTFVEVYLEDYHVDAVHPGLGQLVDCTRLKWEFGEEYSVQTVALKDGLRRAGSAIYENWRQRVLEHANGVIPEFGAIWMTYYPNIMIEWYPYTLVVSVVLPKGPEHCTVLTEFYYPEDILLFEPELIAAEQAAYFETAAEDNEICQRMHAGRRALYRQRQNDTGPYQSPLEDGMQHFHAWYQRHLGDGRKAP